MKINDSHIDEKTKKLFQETGFDKPSEDFTFNVMKDVEKEKNYGKSAGDNLWQILLAVGLPVIYFLAQFLRGEANTINEVLQGLKSSSYIEFIRILYDSIIQDISLSPIVYLGIIAILLLLMFDRVILRLMHSG